MFQVHCKNRDAYIAAVVDYAPAFDSDHKRLTMINLDNYEKHIAEAKERVRTTASF